MSNSRNSPQYPSFQASCVEIMLLLAQSQQHCRDANWHMGRHNITEFRLKGPLETTQFTNGLKSLILVSIKTVITSKYQCICFSRELTRAASQAMLQADTKREHGALQSQGA